MGEILNLRLARKARARAEAERAAAANRLLHGRTKQEKGAAAAEQARLRAAIDGAKIERGED